MTNNLAKKHLVNLGVSGEAGSFSEEAGILYAKEKNISISIKYLIDMEGVLKAVNDGKIELGIFPVVNSRGGLVQTAFEAMGRHNFVMIDKLEFEVHQCLMVLPGINASTISQIASHPQALTQCQDYLNKNFSNVKLIPWEDTAKAAKDLATEVLPATTAVIAPARSAEIYKLKLLEKNIEDVKPNITTFIIITNTQFPVPKVAEIGNYTLSQKPFGAILKI